MVNDDGIVNAVKLSAMVTVSKELFEHAPSMTDWFRPDTRTPEQREAARLDWLAKQAIERKRIEDEHTANLAAADPLVRPFLVLHGPFWGQYDNDPKCDGCEFIANYEGESPDWPCRTYDLAMGRSE